MARGAVILTLSSWVCTPPTVLTEIRHVYQAFESFEILSNSTIENDFQFIPSGHTKLKFRRINVDAT